MSDLQGGHSGDDIDKGRVNSNRALARLLWSARKRFGLCLSHFDGGNLRNAIPREATALFGVPAHSKAEFEAFYERFAADLAAEFHFREPNFRISLAAAPQPATVIDAATLRNLLHAVVGLPNGVVEMSFVVPGLVETSTNLASVKFGPDCTIVVTSSQRSSVESEKPAVVELLCFEVMMPASASS